MSSLSVSVVTPSYNQAKFIRDTIESVRQQTYDDVTHLVIDGESDDGTLDVLREYDDIEWTSEPDRGQTHAINKGFDRAEGDIIGWLNSDDPYVYRTTVNTVVETFERTGADIVYGHAITIGPNNEFLRAHYLPEFDREKLDRHCFLIQPTVFFRRRVIEDHRLNENREYSMDYEFWFDLADHYDWYRLDRVVAADRNHPARKIIQNADESQADTRKLREERGINRNVRFKLLQTLDKLDLRWRRLLGLRCMKTIMASSSDAFAFPLQRRSLGDTIRTQLLGGKKDL